MAEFVIGPLVSMVREKATSYLLDQYKVMEGMEEQRSILERKLPAILDVIHEAEENRNYRQGVRAWLDALRTVSYEAIDVFDEFKYEALRRDAKKKGHYTILGMDVVSLFPSHNPIVFRYRMGKKLRRIVQTIEVLVAEMNAFGFQKLQPPPPSNQLPQTDSIMPDSEKDIVSRSREEEKDKILKILLDRVSGMDDLMVLPIVGMGGLGKTTFVKLIYNHPEIKKCFELQRWCCVSEDFDVANIASSICMKNMKDREQAFQDLQKEVNGRKYLIVLDDVWNEDGEKWRKLKTCLQHGGKGSAILTTTRKTQVAQIMKMGIDEYNLEKLRKDFLKEMIRRRAFSLPNSDQIVDKIVDRCDGSPLAANAFGSMLSTKTRMQEWEGVLTKSNICNGTEILPILKLSYDDLPSHMKPCFAFCAVFPKDHEIEVDKLIRLWMAHDFIPPQEEDHLETKGDHLETKGVEIFKELVWRSFFQDVKPIHQDVKQIHTFRGTTCKIHDLMHDIAQSVRGKQCVTITDSRNHKDLVSNPTRHLFTSYRGVGNGIWFGDFLKKQSPTFRSLLFPHGRRNGGWQRHISKCNSLRALQLFYSKELPFKPRHVQHLRYLDLSDSWITELPKEISMLYNLQTLNLSDCWKLCRLPKDMKYMTSLRHLYTNGCRELKCMPEDLGQLTSLQTLTYFVVGASLGCGTVGELENLNLGGELQLCGLENVTEEQAKAARLVNKDKLTHLSLEWRGNNSDREPLPDDSHKKVLDALKPHDGIQMLRIDSYKSTGLPTWMTDLSVLKQLVELHLVGCKICEEFPQFWHFESLGVLHLERLDKLKNLCSGTASSAFPALKELRLLDLEMLERWVSNEGEELTFPLLEKVEIRNCPKLTSIPEAPNLSVVELEEEKAQLSLSILRSRYIMSSLAKLVLRVRDKEATLQLDQDREASASEMELDGCAFFFSSSPSQPTTGIWKWFGQLVDLHICSCDVLIYWPEEEFLCLVALKKLRIEKCSKLIGPTPVKGEPNRARDQLLPHLTSLTIDGCVSLTELFVLPTSLKSITIKSCDKFEFIWGKEDAALGSVQEEHCNNLAASTSIPEQSPAAPRNHSLPCLQTLTILFCASFVTLQNLPASLKRLRITCCHQLRSVSGASGQLASLESLHVSDCNKLESLDCLGDLPSLDRLFLRSCNKLESLDCLGNLPSLDSLFLWSCKRLCSLPGVDGSYSLLRRLEIEYCPALNMKPLYERHRRRLDGLERRDLSRAHSSDPSEGPKLRDPKSWKYATLWCRRAIQADDD